MLLVSYVVKNGYNAGKSSEVLRGGASKANRGYVLAHCPSLLLAEKNKWTKSYLCAMKRILYDMGLVTLVRRLFQTLFKFQQPFRPGSKLKRIPLPKIEKIVCLKAIIRQTPVF